MGARAAARPGTGHRLWPATDGLRPATLGLCLQRGRQGKGERLRAAAGPPEPRAQHLRGAAMRGGKGLGKESEKFSAGCEKPFSSSYSSSPIPRISLLVVLLRSFSYSSSPPPVRLLIFLPSLSYSSPSCSCIPPRIPSLLLFFLSSYSSSPRHPSSLPSLVVPPPIPPPLPLLFLFLLFSSHSSSPSPFPPPAVSHCLQTDRPWLSSHSHMCNTIILLEDFLPDLWFFHVIS